MARQRAQSIIIQDNRTLFGVGLIGKELYGHFFIGGGVENGESAEEAAIRELREEANIEGKILFKLEDEYLKNHNTFLVDIGEQVPSLGVDPELEKQGKDLAQRAFQGLELLDLKEFEKFTSIDITYFKTLISECKKRSYKPDWLNVLAATVLEAEHIEKA